MCVSVWLLAWGIYAVVVAVFAFPWALPLWHANLFAWKWRLTRISHFTSRLPGLRFSSQFTDSSPGSFRSRRMRSISHMHKMLQHLGVCRVFCLFFGPRATRLAPLCLWDPVAALAYADPHGLLSFWGCENPITVQCRLRTGSPEQAKFINWQSIETNGKEQKIWIF